MRKSEYKLTEEEINYIETLEKYIILDDEKGLKSLIRTSIKAKRRFKIIALEIDISGYYKLKLRKTNKSIYALNSRFKNKSRIELKDLILDRISSLKKEGLELYGNLYTVSVDKIEYNGEQISVNKICNNGPDFVLFQSKDNKFDYYFRLTIYEADFRYNRVIKLDKVDTNKIIEGEISCNEIEINKYI